MNLLLDDGSVVSPDQYAKRMEGGKGAAAPAPATRIRPVTSVGPGPDGEALAKSSPSVNPARDPELLAIAMDEQGFNPDGTPKSVNKSDVDVNGEPLPVDTAPSYAAAVRAAGGQIAEQVGEEDLDPVRSEDFEKSDLVFIPEDGLALDVGSVNRAAPNPIEKSDQIEPIQVLVKGLAIASVGPSGKAVEWANQFYSDPKLRVEALQCVRDAMDLARDEALREKAEASWDDQQEWPRSRRRAYDAKRAKEREALQSRSDAIKVRMAELEARLVDGQIKEAEVQVKLGKSAVDEAVDMSSLDALENLAGPMELAKSFYDSTSVLDWARKFYSDPFDVKALGLARDLLKLRQDHDRSENTPKTVDPKWVKFNKQEKAIIQKMHTLEVEYLAAEESHAKKMRAASKGGLDVDLEKGGGGPFIGPRGGKWADAAHTIPWDEGAGGGSGDNGKKMSPGEVVDLASDVVIYREKGSKEYKKLANRSLSALSQGSMDSLRGGLKRLNLIIQHQVETGNKDAEGVAKKAIALVNQIVGNKSGGKESGGGGSKKMDPKQARTKYKEIRAKWKSAVQADNHAEAAKQARAMHAHIKATGAGRSELADWRARAERSESKVGGSGGKEKGPGGKMSQKEVTEQNNRAINEAKKNPGKLKDLSDDELMSRLNAASKKTQAAHGSGDKKQIEATVKEYWPLELERQRRQKETKKSEMNDMLGKSLTDWLDVEMEVLNRENDLHKSGPYIGPKGGKWADPQHKVPWKEGMEHLSAKEREGSKPEDAGKLGKLGRAFGALRQQATNLQAEFEKYDDEAERIRAVIKSPEFKQFMPKHLMAPRSPEYKAVQQQLNAAVEMSQTVLAKLRKLDDAWGKIRANIMGGKVDKAMNEAVDLLKSLGAGDLPTGEPKMGSGEEDGGTVEGAGKTSGASDIGAKTPNRDAPKPKRDKLSEDDEDEDGALKPHTKPIESLKSMTPGGIREANRAAEAAEARRLIKGEGYVVPDLDLPVQAEPEHLRKGQQWADGMVLYSDQSDVEAAALIKSDEIYAGGTPDVGVVNPHIHSHLRCPRCKTEMAKSLSVCPECGLGVSARSLTSPRVDDDGTKMSKSGGPGLRPAPQQFVKITD